MAQSYLFVGPGGLRLQRSDLAPGGKRSYAPYVARVVVIMESGTKQWESYPLVVEMELLVKSIRDRDAIARDRAEAFLRWTSNLGIHSVDRVVARRAADVRARTRLPALHSIIVATALEPRCDAIIGNDAIMASRVASDIPCLYLDDYV